MNDERLCDSIVMMKGKIVNSGTQKINKKTGRTLKKL